MVSKMKRTPILRHNSTPNVDGLLDTITLSQIPFAAGATSQVYFARIARETGSPLHLVVKSEKRRLKTNDYTPEDEYYLHRQLTNVRQKYQFKHGIQPALYFFSRDVKSPLPKSSILLPFCEFKLSNSMETIKAIKQLNPLLFQKILYAFISDMMTAFQCLNDERIIHLDINKENIGFRNGGWELFDFSESETYDIFLNSNKANVIKGSPYYVAPEIAAKQREIPFAADLWSFAQILNEMIGKPIDFSESKNIDHLLSLKKEAYFQAKTTQSLPENYQELLRNNILKCDDFMHSLEHLILAMTHPLPAFRPGLATLKAIHKHLAELTPKHLDAKLVEFYNELLATHKMVFTEAKPASPFEEDEVEVEVEEYNLNSTSASNSSTPTGSI